MFLSAGQLEVFMLKSKEGTSVTSFIRFLLQNRKLAVKESETLFSKYKPKYLQWLYLQKSGIGWLNQQKSRAYPFLSTNKFLREPSFSAIWLIRIKSIYFQK